MIIGQIIYNSSMHAWVTLVIIIMLTDLRLDNRRGWFRGWAKLCTCLVG